MSISLKVQPGLTRDDFKIVAKGFEQRYPILSELKLCGYDHARWKQKIVENAMVALYSGGKEAQAFDDHMSPDADVKIMGDQSLWDNAVGVWSYRLQGHYDKVVKLNRRPRRPTLYIRALPGPSALQSLTSEPTLVDHELWDNSGSAIFSHEAVTLSGTVTIGTETSWSESEEKSISATVGVTVGTDAIGASAETTVGYVASTGKAGGDSKTEEIGNASELSLDVPPDQIYAAVLTISRGEADVLIPVVTTLVGDVLGGGIDGRWYAFSLADLDLKLRAETEMLQHVSSFADRDQRVIGPLPDDELETIERVALESHRSRARR